jgi:hypothetical protein
MKTSSSPDPLSGAGAPLRGRPRLENLLGNTGKPHHRVSVRACHILVLILPRLLGVGGY